MKTVSINTYKFSELSDEAKQKAIENLCTINVDYDWWECTYDDAKAIGLLLSGFNLDRNKHASGDLDISMVECCRLIIANHGEICNTAVTAATYLETYDKLVEKYSDGGNKYVVAEDKEYDFDQEADELQDDFLNAILEDYANILQDEYEYLTSEAAIVETIEANDYDFTEDGKIW